MKQSQFEIGDTVKYNNDKSLYRVEKVGLWFYTLKYLSFDTHGNCVLRSAGTEVEYVNNNFTLIRKLSKLEKAMK